MLDFSFLAEQEHAVPFYLPKGTVLTNQGERMDYLYFLTEGVCDRMVYTEEGDEMVLYRKQPNEGINSMIGVHSLWYENFVSPHTFVAVTDIKGIRLPSEEAKYLFQQRVDVMNVLHEDLVKKYSDLREKYQIRLTNHVANQICEFIYQNLEEQQGTYHLKKNCSNATISQRLNVHQVTVANVMSYLQKTGVIKRDKRKITVLNMLQLKRYAAGERLPYRSKTE